MNGGDNDIDKTKLAATQRLSNSRSSLNHVFNLNYQTSNTTNGSSVAAVKPNGSTGFRPSHSRTRSDQTGILFNSSNNRTNSATTQKFTIGDLMSGRAFDNNCNCFEQQQLANQLTQNSDGSGTNGASVVETNGELNGIDEENKENEQDTKNKFECICSAPRLAPELEFTKSLISIGKKLIRINTKEAKSMWKLLLT